MHDWSLPLNTTYLLFCFCCHTSKKFLCTSSPNHEVAAVEMAIWFCSQLCPYSATSLVYQKWVVHNLLLIQYSFYSIHILPSLPTLESRECNWNPCSLGCPQDFPKPLSSGPCSGRSGLSCCRSKIKFLDIRERIKRWRREKEKKLPCNGLSNKKVRGENYPPNSLGIPRGQRVFLTKLLVQFPNFTIWMNPLLRLSY